METLVDREPPLTDGEESAVDQYRRRLKAMRTRRFGNHQRVLLYSGSSPAPDETDADIMNDILIFDPAAEVSPLPSSPAPLNHSDPSSSYSASSDFDDLMLDALDIAEANDDVDINSEDVCRGIELEHDDGGMDLDHFSEQPPTFEYVFSSILHDIEMEMSTEDRPDELAIEDELMNPELDIIANDESGTHIRRLPYPAFYRGLNAIIARTTVHAPADALRDLPPLPSDDSMWEWIGLDHEPGGCQGDRDAREQDRNAEEWFVREGGFFDEIVEED